MRPESEANFHKKSAENYDTRDTPFDYESIMLYPSDAFGKEDGSGRRRTTIQPLKPGVEIRQEIVADSLEIILTIRGAVGKTSLSAVDAVELARAYQPKTGGYLSSMAVFCTSVLWRGLDDGPDDKVIVSSCYFVSSHQI